MLLGERVHARAGGEVVGRLGAAVQHDDQRHRLAAVGAGDVELVAAAPGVAAEGSRPRTGRRPATARGPAPGRAGQPAQPRRQAAAPVDPLKEAAQRLRQLRQRGPCQPAGRPQPGAEAARRPGRRAGPGSVTLPVSGSTSMMRGWRPAAGAAVPCGVPDAASGGALAAEQALQQRRGLGEPAFAGEAGRLEHGREAAWRSCQGLSVRRRRPGLLARRLAPHPAWGVDDGSGDGGGPAEGVLAGGAAWAGQRVRSASAAFTAALACSAPSTEIEAIVARASSGVTSAAMLARPSTRMSSLWPAARAASRSCAAVVPQAEVEAFPGHGLLGRVGMPLDLVADGGADEVGPVRVEAVLDQQVDVAEIDVAEVDGDLFGVAPALGRSSCTLSATIPSSYHPMDGKWKPIRCFQGGKLAIRHRRLPGGLTLWARILKTVLLQSLRRVGNGRGR